MKEFLILTGCTTGVVAGNFVFQNLTSQNWGVAFERSFFQVLMSLVLGIALLATREIRNGK